MNTGCLSSAPPDVPCFTCNWRPVDINCSTAVVFACWWYFLFSWFTIKANIKGLNRTTNPQCSKSQNVGRTLIMQLASNCQATNPLSPPQCLFLGLLFSFIVWQLTSPVFYIYYANRVCWVAFEFDGRLPTWRMCTVTVFAAASQNAENHLTSYSLMHYITGAIFPKMVV